MDWMISPPNLSVEDLTPRVGVFGVRTSLRLKEDSRVEFWSDKISALFKKSYQRASTLFLPRDNM